MNIEKKCALLFGSNSAKVSKFFDISNPQKSLIFDSISLKISVLVDVSSEKVSFVW